MTSPARSASRSRLLEGPPEIYPEKCPRCRLRARQGVGRERRADGRGESDQQVALLARRRGETQPRSDPHPRCSRDVDEGWRGADLAAGSGLCEVRGAVPPLRAATTAATTAAAQVAALASGAKHVPFRNSKLTHLMQNALSGSPQDTAASSLLAGGSAEGHPTSRLVQDAHVCQHLATGKALQRVGLRAPLRPKGERLPLEQQARAAGQVRGGKGGGAGGGSRLRE